MGDVVNITPAIFTFRGLFLVPNFGWVELGVQVNYIFQIQVNRGKQARDHQAGSQVC